jgi:hypothetical protein
MIIITQKKHIVGTLKMNNYEHLSFAAIKKFRPVDNDSKSNVVVLVGISYNILKLSKLKTEYFTYRY